MERESLIGVSGTFGRRLEAWELVTRLELRVLVRDVTWITAERGDGGHEGRWLCLFW